jgi:glutaconate CoA-transferase subunit B
LQLTALFAGATVDEARAAVGWPLLPGPAIETLPAPTISELHALRALHSRTREAHSRPVHVPA